MQYQLATDYLPHETPMVMLQDVHLVNNENCICSVQVSTESVLAPFLNKQSALPNYYAIELMAQTIGVWNGYHGQKTNHKTQLGMLLGGRAIKLTVSEFPLGSLLIIHAKLILHDNKLASFECELKVDDICLASGRLNVYEPDESEMAMLFGEHRLGEK